MKIKSVISEDPENLNEFGLNVSSAQIEWRWADEERSIMSYDERAETSWQFDAEEGMSFRIVFWKQALIYFFFQKRCYLVQTYLWSKYRQFSRIPGTLIL